jgi:Tol biopolymer transport system component
MNDERSINGRAIPPRRAIYVLNLEDGTISKIADGMSPVWSPSGEWIAFYDYSPHRDDVKRGWYAVNANRVSLMHPDGSNSKVLATFHNDEDLHAPSVWSPDSKTILVNKFYDEDKAIMDIYMLDIATLKLTKKFKATSPIFAWVNEK